MIAAKPNSVRITRLCEPPAAFHLSAYPAADQFADEAAEEHDEAGAAHLLDVEAMHFVQVVRHPGQQAVEQRVEAHPAEEHAPDRAIPEEIQHAAAGQPLRFAVFVGVRRFDVACLGIVDAGMLARRIADVTTRRTARPAPCRCRRRRRTAATIRAKRSAPI